MAPSQKVYVVGVGMTKFIKPRDLRDYPGTFLLSPYGSISALPLVNFTLS